MVFLEPRADADGGLHLYSRQGRFGADGAYLVLEAGGDRLRARRIPVVEHFHLYVDADGDLRTDHDLRLWNIPSGTPALPDAPRPLAVPGPAGAALPRDFAASPHRAKARRGP